MSEKQKKFLPDNAALMVILGIAACCLLVYAQTIYFSFINIDDRAYIYENRAVLSGFNWNSIRWAFTSVYSANWHPLTWVSHIVDVSLFGLSAGGHHAVNVIFHAINSILAFVVFRRLTGDFWKSAIVAFLFALHPTHVESVAWIAERKDVLSTMLWLLTMLAYFNYARSKDIQTPNKDTKKPDKNKAISEVRNPKTKDRKFYYFLTILLFALGLMSKPMLVTLPFVLLLCDFWALERWKSIKDLPALVIEKIPLFALTIASSVITYLAQKSAGAVVAAEMLPFDARFFNVILSYAKYIVMLFYPVNLGLWYPIEPSVSGWQIAGALILLAVISVFCWQQRNRRKYLLMGWLWFLGTLVPVIGIVQVGLQSLADRYTYVPYFGLFIMLVWGLGDVFRKYKVAPKVVAAVCAIVLLIFGFLTFKQVGYWRNSETLYTHTLSFTKNNYFLMSNLCLHYVHHAPIETTEKRCAELFGAMPPSTESQNILGLIRTQAGKYDEAIQNFQNAAQLKPDWGIPYANASAAFVKQGRLDEAERFLQRAFSMSDARLNADTLARSSNALGLAYVQKNQTEKAIQYFNKALELQPNFAEAAENLKKARGEK